MKTSNKSNLLIFTLIFILVPVALFKMKILEYKNEKLTFDQYNIPIYGWAKKAVTSELEEVLELKELTTVKEINPGTFLPKQELNIEFKDKKDRDCYATLSVKFPNEEDKEKNIAILTADKYICLSKGIVIPTVEYGNLDKENGSYVNMKELYLAYKGKDKYIVDHKLNIFTKKINEKKNIENSWNYIEALDNIGKVYFELDKSKEYVLIYHPLQKNKAR